jgi:hypothetical protein
MSQRGDCWDNAPVDSVFATLKLELVYHRRYIPPEVQLPPGSEGRHL